jgi:aminopeptidase
MVNTHSFVTPSKARVAQSPEFIDAHAAFIGLVGADPDAFAGVDPARMGLAMQAQAIASSFIQQQITSNVIPWVGVAMASPAWARKVFPDKTPDEALTALWNHIFHATRVDTPDPVAVWKSHVEELGHRVVALDRAHFARLRYRGPGTDLTIELPALHRWLGGGATDSRGVFFVPNLPTEEVFSAPDAPASMVPCAGRCLYCSRGQWWMASACALKVAGSSRMTRRRDARRLAT